MTQVVARPGESFESLVRRFKKVVEYSGLLADVKKHEFFEKPSVQKKRKQAEARKRSLKKLRGKERFVPVSGQNFKFNKDKTQKIPTLPPKKNFTFKKKNYSRPDKIKPIDNKGK